MADPTLRSFLVTHPDEPFYKAVAFVANPSAARSACAEISRQHGERVRRSKYKVVRVADFDPLLDFDLPEVIDFDAAVHILTTGSTEPPAV